MAQSQDDTSSSEFLTDMDVEEKEMTPINVLDAAQWDDTELIRAYDAALSEFNVDYPGGTLADPVGTSSWTRKLA